MNKDKIINLARQSGLNVECANEGDGIFIGLSHPLALENFVKLIELDKETKEKILYALELGRDAAYQVAQEYHCAMAGYRKNNHDMLDNDVRMIDNSIELAKQL